MKRFVFSLQSVLTLRKNRENDALTALGGAQRAYQQAQAFKQNLQNQLAASLDRREALGRPGDTAVISFQVEQSFITGTKQRIIQSDQAIMRASRNVEKALRAYLMARRQTRMIEILREKAYNEYKAERAKRERKELDELITMRARFIENSPLHANMDGDEPVVSDRFEQEEIA